METGCYLAIGRVTFNCRVTINEVATKALAPMMETNVY